jgi:hypothetical protein
VDKSPKTHRRSESVVRIVEGEIKDSNKRTADDRPPGLENRIINNFYGESKLIHQFSLLSWGSSCTRSSSLRTVNNANSLIGSTDHHKSNGHDNGSE